ncbi:MAG TPA: hypothetical protein VJQ82_05910 [Terriglobales bacterium]|nr:hypothetical protein [Terriglobales bacterium]
MALVETPDAPLPVLSRMPAGKDEGAVIAPWAEWRNFIISCTKRKLQISFAAMDLHMSRETCLKSRGGWAFRDIR